MCDGYLDKWEYMIMYIYTNYTWYFPVSTELATGSGGLLVHGIVIHILSHTMNLGWFGSECSCGVLSIKLCMLTGISCNFSRTDGCHLRVCYRLQVQYNACLKWSKQILHVYATCTHIKSVYFFVSHAVPTLIQIMHLFILANSAIFTSVSWQCPGPNTRWCSKPNGRTWRRRSWRGEHSFVLWLDECHQNPVNIYSAIVSRVVPYYWLNARPAL